MEQLTQDNHKCTENYKDYLQNYVNLYKDLQRECEGKINSNKYCDYFKTYFSDKDSNLLSTWTCELKETKEQTTQIKERSSVYVGQTQLQPTLTAISGSEEQARPSVPHSDSSSSGMGISASSLNGIPTPITSKSITAIASTAGFLVPSFLMYKVISIISIII
ncbi:hypothetical protein PVIIG_06424 [Plasmodium vivax India VII]|uniref:Variable surface protein Vir7-like protein n=1 Tax=Plasmodium vivax India VII TaxID=1077284 RepID=A0A0J9S291_PLAVI|nr:hypothetical protein PVIIG_06424 [Plasmodium vivax India VII]